MANADINRLIRLFPGDYGKEVYFSAKIPPFRLFLPRKWRRAVYVPYPPRLGIKQMHYGHNGSYHMKSRHRRLNGMGAAAWALLHGGIARRLVVRNRLL